MKLKYYIKNEGKKAMHHALSKHIEGFDKDVFECLIEKVIIGEIEEDVKINPYTIRFICKNGTELNCKDKFTATSDKQAAIHTASSDKQRTWSV